MGESVTPDWPVQLIADDRGRYVDCNQAACDLLGYDRAELLQLSVWDLTPDGNEVDGLALWQDFIGLGMQAGVYWLRRRDGAVVEVEYRALANVSPGRHASWLRPFETGREPFPRSRLRSRPKPS